MSLTNLLAFALISVAITHVYASIPALFWSPERSMTDLPDFNAHDIINADTFLKSYLDPLLKDSTRSAVVFLQDKLHVDDFTKFADVYNIEGDGGAFKNLKNLLENHFSLELPQVLKPATAVEKLKASFDKVHSVKSLNDVEHLDLTNDKSVLIIVHLEPIQGSADQEKALKENDATIGAISRHLQKRSINYSALFTAQSAGEGLNGNGEAHSNRHLLETSLNSNGTGTFMNVSDGHIYVFLRDAKLCLKKGKVDNDIYSGPCDVYVNLTITEDTANQSESTNKTASVVLNFPNMMAGNLSLNVQLKIDSELYWDKWDMKSFVLNVTFNTPNSGFNDSLSNATLSKGDQDMVINVMYSYHCTEMKLFLDYIHQKDLSDYKGSYLLLDGFQIQTFYIYRNRFSYSQDCVPYFTTPIWMFLFTSAFLLLILYFGTIMLLNLSIMDRYDDPKGKTIVVNTGAE